MTRLLLIRHGQSTWNAEGRWQGWADAPLSPDGLADAARAAGHGALEEIETVYSSDLQRARVTAAVIADRRRLRPPVTYRGLRERDQGSWTGLTRAEIEVGWPGALERRPLEPPDGESRLALLARAVATLHRIAQDHPGGSVLAISHGGLIRLLEHHLGAESRHLTNLAGRWFDVEAPGGAGPAATIVPGRRVELLVPEPVEPSLPAGGDLDETDEVDDDQLPPHQAGRPPEAGSEGTTSTSGTTPIAGLADLDFGAGDIAGIDHIQLAMPPGEAAERAAVTFYVDVLGIPRVPKPAALARRGGCWFERPPLRVHLGVEEEFRPARKAHPALAVTDLDKVQRWLEAKGVTVSVGSDAVGGLRQIYVDDPFGNRIELLQRR